MDISIGYIHINPWNSSNSSITEGYISPRPLLKGSSAMLLF